MSGVITAIVFYAVTGIGNIFDWLYRSTSFVDMLIGISILGSYAGAGYVGWRIAEKHYHDREKRFVKRYTRYSAFTLFVLVAVVFSPLSFLGILWSFVAPLCVLWSLNYIQKNKK